MYLTYPGEATTIQYDSAIAGITSFLSFSDDATGETTEKYFIKTFAYSEDNQVYSSWISLTLENLNSIQFKPNMWFKFMYEVQGQTTNTVMSVENVTLTYNQTITSPEVCICSFTRCSRIQGCNDCGNLGSFDPYQVDQEKLFYEETNKEVEQRYGIPVQYWKLNPQIRSGDVIFKEWTLNHVSKDYSIIKLIVDRNEFPDSKINYNIWGADYEDNFEVSIMKSTWESVYGEGTMPQKGDFMFMPLNNRMYEIKSSYLFRGFMQMPIWYKCSLTKHQPKLSNIVEPETEADLSKYVITTDEIFKDEKIFEEDRLVKEIQHHTYTEQNDITRKGVDKETLLIEYRLLNDFTLVSEYHYDLSSAQNPAIVYQSSIDMSNERSFMCWFKPKSYTDRTINVTNQVPDGTSLRIYQQNHNFKKDDWLKIKDYQNVISFIKIADVTKDYFLISYTVPLITYQKVHHNVLFSGGRSSLSVEFLDQELQVYLASTQYIFSLPALDSEKWYTVMINFSNTYRQLTLNLWERSNESTNDLTRYNNGNTKLKQIFEQTYNLTSEFNVVIPDQYWYLSNTEFNITNIRLFKSTVEKEKQHVILNQNIVQDAQNIILADNALPRVNIVKISKNL